MINILLVKGAFQEFRYAEASGHAGFAEKGYDIVCASVTILLKTAVLSLKNKENSCSGLKIKAKAEQTGELTLEVLRCSERDYSYLAALADFLLTGLSSICREYPSHVNLKVKG